MIFEAYSGLRLVCGSTFAYLPYLSAVSIENEVVMLWKSIGKKGNVFDDVLHRKCEIL